MRFAVTVGIGFGMLGMFEVGIFVGIGILVGILVGIHGVGMQVGIITYDSRNNERNAMIKSIVFILSSKKKSKKTKFILPNQ